MNYQYLQFFNIQYWYCVVVSLFGAECTTTDTISGGVATTTAAVSKPGFWEWLFGVSGSGASSAPTGFFGTLFAVIGGVFGFLWALYSAIAFIVSFFLFVAILWFLIGIFLIRAHNQELYGTLSPASEGQHPLRSRWQALIEDAMSSDPKRWKEGILAADMLLGELFARLGYAGKGTSEQIQQIPEGAFANLPSAWEAHRIRNMISTSSSHYILTQREAFRVMKLYEQVFKEFDFI